MEDNNLTEQKTQSKSTQNNTIATDVPIKKTKSQKFKIVLQIILSLCLIVVISIFTIVIEHFVIKDFGLQVSDCHLENNVSEMYCVATITNNTSSTYESIDVNAVFMDDYGQVIATTNHGYYIGSLSPNESFSFSVKTPYNPSIVRCNMLICNYF